MLPSTCFPVIEKKIEKYKQFSVCIFFSQNQINDNSALLADHHADGCGQKLRTAALRDRRF